MKLKFYFVAGGNHPKLGAVFYRMARAVGGEEASRYDQYMCEVLESLAQSTADCDQYLTDIASVEHGQIDRIETGANDVTLTITKAGVHVDIMVNEDWVGRPEANFTLGEWTAALAGWRRFLELPQSVDSFLEIDL
jgi:hypothetical protein